MARRRKSCRPVPLIRFGMVAVVFTMASSVFLVNYFGINQTEDQDRYRLQKAISDDGKTNDEHGKKAQVDNQMKVFDNLLERLEKIEMKLDALQNANRHAMQNLTDYFEKRYSVNQNPQGEVISDDVTRSYTDPACSYQPDELKDYPKCNGKIAWMLKRWGTNPCYKRHGVDGTECTIIIYLSEVETWCPILKGREILKPQEPQATLRKDIDGLVSILDSAEKKRLAWLKSRVERMWNSQWMPAVDNIITKNELTDRKQKEIFIHMGFLTGDFFAKNTKTGGSLGEMVQWSDIITSLYILGHNIVVSVDPKLKSYERKANSRNSCPDHGSPDRPYDLVYTDIAGLHQMKKSLSDSWLQLRCKLRVIDSFGTEPSFNIKSYMERTERKSYFGGWELNPQQFFTLFPHSPDNSFMGFAVENYNNTELMKPAKKTNKALVYAKRSYMWKNYNARQILDVIKTTFEIHATVHIDSKKPDEVRSVPSYVKNHGVVSGDEIQKLLRQTKLFIGIGFPYEGPAPLEAIANGCVFLNPSFSPPKNKLNEKFFVEKPTERELTSQSPYAEVYIGKPHVWTLDVFNSTALREAVEEISKADAPEPYLPFEFQCEGMLQRLSTYISNQDFCDLSNSWPPKSSMHIRVAKTNQSCQARCVEDDLICEPSWFPHINLKEVIEKQFFTTCSEVEELEDIFFPSINQTLKTCQTQRNNLLFSCVGQRDDLQRVCPCRTYIKEQVALCKECL